MLVRITPPGEATLTRSRLPTATPTLKFLAATLTTSGDGMRVGAGRTDLSERMGMTAPQPLSIA